MTAEAEGFCSLRAGDIRFSYLRAGRGVPIVLLHGWPQTAHAWQRIVPLLAGDYDVIAPDLPGFGNSSKPETGFDKRTIARRLRDFVHGLGLERVALAGHDLGGHVAYAYAAQWPDEVSHLIFVESSLPGFGQEQAMDVATGGSWHFGFNMAGDISETLVRGREYEFVDFFMRREKVGLFDAESVTDCEIARYARALARPGALRASFCYYRTLPIDRADNAIWGMQPLTMPVLAVGAAWGNRDESARTIRKVACDVRDVIVERCGHYVAEERPAELAEAIRAFVPLPARRVRTPTCATEGKGT